MNKNNYLVVKILLVLIMAPVFFFCFSQISTMIVYLNFAFPILCLEKLASFAFYMFQLTGRLQAIIIGESFIISVYYTFLSLIIFVELMNYYFRRRNYEKDKFTDLKRQILFAKSKNNS